MNQERRRFSRITLAFPARISIGNEPPRPVNEFLDISISGCKISTIENSAPCIPVRLSIPLGDAQPAEEMIIHIGGRILRTDAESTAIVFDSIDPTSLFHLQNLIRYNAPDSDRIDSEIEKRRGIL